MESRPQWTTRFAFLLAASGAAIGLGNIWKFPYIVGDNGGGAFIFVYLFCLVIIGVPVLFAETFCGQLGQTDPLETFKRLTPTKSWRLLPTVGLLGAIFVISFYSVIGGWIARYTVATMRSELSTVSLTSPLGEEIGYHFVFLLLVFAINLGGIKKGIEVFNKFAMPSLFLILGILLAYALTLPGLSQSFQFLFIPRFSDLSINSVMEAIGHAFFTLGVGVCSLMTYGSFLPRNYNVAPLSILTGLIDTVVALVCGLVIFAVVFSSGLTPAQGPQLIFITLPHLFSAMPFGAVIGFFFFALVFFAALTSGIAMIEPLICLVENRFKKTRSSSCLLVWAVTYGLGLLVILSSSSSCGFSLLGNTLFDILDKTTTHLIMPFFGIGTALFVGWKLDTELKKQLNDQSVMYHYLSWCLRVVAPVGITSVLLKAAWSQIIEIF